MQCAVCGDRMSVFRQGTILRKHQIDYFSCGACGFRCTELPYWLDEAYSDAITRIDTGIMRRNLFAAGVLSRMLPRVCPHGPYVDWAGGLGILVRLMRDRGFDFYWSDLYATNEVARGFEYSRDVTGPASCVTAIEVLEHVVDPPGFIEQVLDATGADMIAFSQVLASPRTPDDWWYYAPLSGQHVSFYELRTLQTLGARLGLQLSRRAGLFVLSRHAIPNVSLREWAFEATWKMRAQIDMTLRGSLTQYDHELLLKS